MINWLIICWLFSRERKKEERSAGFLSPLSLLISFVGCSVYISVGRREVKVQFRSIQKVTKGSGDARVKESLTIAVTSAFYLSEMRAGGREFRFQSPTALPLNAVTLNFRLKNVFCIILVDRSKVTPIGWPSSWIRPLVLRPLQMEATSWNCGLRLPGSPLEYRAYYYTNWRQERLRKRVSSNNPGPAPPPWLDDRFMELRFSG